MVNKNLIVAATNNEAELIAASYNVHISNYINILDENSDLLITGIGVSNTLISLANYIYNNGIPKQIVDIGICGSYEKNINICDVVIVNQEIYADNIVQSKDTNKFWNSNFDILETPEILIPQMPKWDCLVDLQKVRGVTSSVVSGNLETINFRKQHFLSQVESMEGAAIFDFSNRLKVKSVQVRAVSNYVEERDKSKWQIPAAIQALSNYVISNIIPILK